MSTRANCAAPACWSGRKRDRTGRGGRHGSRVEVSRGGRRKRRRRMQLWRWSRGCRQQPRPRTMSTPELGMSPRDDHVRQFLKGSWWNIRCLAHSASRCAPFWVVHGLTGRSASPVRESRSNGGGRVPQPAREGAWIQSEAVRPLVGRPTAEGRDQNPRGSRPAACEPWHMDVAPLEAHNGIGYREQDCARKGLQTRPRWR